MNTMRDDTGRDVHYSCPYATKANLHEDKRERCATASHHLEHNQTHQRDSLIPSNPCRHTRVESRGFYTVDSCLTVLDKYCRRERQ